MSEAPIWGWLRAFYENQGVAAWAMGRVPSFITTNVTIARSVAATVHAHLCDLLARDEVDLGQPVYVVELGSGPGRFAFLVLRALNRLLQAHPLPGLTLRYVLTDVAESNLAAQAIHPRFSAPFASGVLDQALFDCESSSELALRHSGDRIGPDRPGNPMIVLGNYVLDSLRQDSFRVAGGVLAENLVDLTTVTGPPDPQALDRMSLDYRTVPVPPGRYADPILTSILAGYATALPESSVLIPVGALECLARLRAMCGDRLLLLTADKGYAHLDELGGQTDPTVMSFSMWVNFHAIGEYVRQSGGRWFTTGMRNRSLSVNGFVLHRPSPDEPGAGSGAERGWPATAAAFDEQFAHCGADHRVVLVEMFGRLAGEMSLPELIAALRSTDHEPRLVGRFGDRLLELAPSASEAQRVELREVTRRCWENYFPVERQPDLPFVLGRLMAAMSMHPDAIRYFEHSLQIFGPSRAAFNNIGLSLRVLGDLDGAVVAFERALAIDPVHSGSRSWRLHTLAERAAAQG